HVDRLERALHRGRLQRARGVEPLAEAHALVDLVGALPPVAGHPREDHQAEGVGAEVDDREPALAHTVSLSAGEEGLSAAGWGGVDLEPHLGAPDGAAPAARKLLDQHEAPAADRVLAGLAARGDEGRAAVVHLNTYA